MQTEVSPVMRGRWQRLLAHMLDCRNQKWNKPETLRVHTHIQVDRRNKQEGLSVQDQPPRTSLNMSVGGEFLVW